MFSYSECSLCGTATIEGGFHDCDERRPTPQAPRPQPDFLPTPAEVAAAQQELRPKEVKLLGGIGNSLRTADSWPQTIDGNLFINCRVERIIAELEKKGWKATRESDRNDWFLSIKPAN